VIATGTGRRLSTYLDAEELAEETAGSGEILAPRAPVVLPAQAGVREVVQEPAEHMVAVGAVLGGVQHVGVPHVVELPGGDDGDTGMQHAELQEAPV
jgi:hypothetical protein